MALPDNLVERVRPHAGGQRSLLGQSLVERGAEAIVGLVRGRLACRHGRQAIRPTTGQLGCRRWRRPAGLPVVFTPERSYVVCGTQRSGTTLLCWALGDTGVLGHPGEYFIDGDPSSFPPGWTFWEDGPIAQEHGVTSRQEFVELVYRLGTTDNGVFGVKLMWNNLPWVARRLQALPQFQGLDLADLLTAVFPRLHVVQVVRRDRVAQAISWAKA